MCSTPEVDKIDSKHIGFSEKCKRLLDLCDEIGTEGEKKHAKRKSKARLKHK